MSLLARNLDKCGQDVIIETRSVKIFNGEPSEVFSNPVTVKAIVSTVTGKSVFDDTNTERVATHKLTLAYTAGITSENWIKLGGRRIKVLTVENCCEQNEALILMCTERGIDSKVVNNG